MTLDDKKYLLSVHNQIIQDKIDAFEDMMAEIYDNDNCREEKNTRVNYHHINEQKQNLMALQKLLQEKIEVLDTDKEVKILSLLQINDFWILLLEDLPKIKLGNQKVYPLSQNSPLGAVLLGKKLGDEVVCEGKKYRINEIL